MFSSEKKSEDIVDCSASVYDSESTASDLRAERPGQGSSFWAYFNIVCVVAGTGALSLPYALRQGGWIGLFILGLSWLMASYCGIILIKCLYANGQKRLDSYFDVGRASFGPIGGAVVFFFNIILLLGVSMLYIMLCGSNFSSVILVGTSAELTPAIWKIIWASIIAVPFVFFRSMKEIGIFSAAGVVCTFICVVIVVAVSVNDHQTNPVPVHHDSVIWSQFPVALSSISFSYGGNPIYPAVEASMRRPKDWNKVVFAGLSTCMAFYFLCAVPGYYIYGDTVMSPIYESLPNSPAKTAAAIIITIHVVLATPLLVTSLALDCERMLQITEEKRGKWMEMILRVIFRIILMVIVVVVAIFVPYFGDFMSMLGAVANCLIIFAFPVICYLKLTGIRNKPIYELAWCFLCVLLGLVGLIFGSMEAGKALMADFHPAATTTP
ncbi:transmembrane amino acid transporter protein-domain-containing protein [Umbelopsis sp. PMI_123]|nr:transmembrane amino acid transporter protein-domain-containing protein [Umbelopsis sp. PMI_123]